MLKSADKLDRSLLGKLVQLEVFDADYDPTTPEPKWTVYGRLVSMALLRDDDKPEETWTNLAFEGRTGTFNVRHYKSEWYTIWYESEDVEVTADESV